MALLEVIIWLVGLFCLLFLIFIVVLLWKRKFVLLLVLLSLPYFSLKIYQYYWFTNILPTQIAVTYPLSMGQASGMIMSGCGVAVFKLSKSTVVDIEKDSLALLNRATQSRGFDTPYYTFKQWTETPVPPNWVSEGAWFMCSVPNKTLTKEIIKAAKEPGSYYTTKPEGELLVIPSLGYAVISYNG